MFVLCVVLQYLVYFLVLHLMVNEREKETWLLYFNCIFDVSVPYIFLNVLLVGLQCVIVAFPGHKNLLFEQVLPDLIDGAPDVISQALLSAPVLGNEQVNGFVCSRLMQNPAKFDDSIKQNGHVLFHQYTK